MLRGAAPLAGRSDAAYGNQPLEGTRRLGYALVLISSPLKGSMSHSPIGPLIYWEAGEKQRVWEAVRL